jgi:2-octaprenyl-6-methoxyphenol hydroxylase
MTASPRIIVLGGGLAGLAFAVAIAKESKTLSRGAPSVTLLEAQAFKAGTPNVLDTRASALNLHSAALLEDWGIWSDLAPDCGVIRDIHVSHRGHFGSTLMQSEDLDTDALGFVAENHHLGRCLLERAKALGVEVRAPERCTALLTGGGRPALQTEDSEVLDADLILLASGVTPDWFDALGITCQQRPTGTHALVFNATFPGRQAGCAFERFTQHGPLAVLPLLSVGRHEQRYNVVWSVSDDVVEALGYASDKQFCAEFQKAFGWRLGAVASVGKRSQWPLVRNLATEQLRAGFLLVGNAAHTLHPVAGQGLNLSLREADLLAKTLATAVEGGQPLAHAGSLRGYLKQVMAEQTWVTRSTDLLATLFNPRGLLLDGPRNASLALLDLVPSARAQIARVGTGYRHA